MLCECVQSARLSLGRTLPQCVVDQGAACTPRGTPLCTPRGTPQRECASSQRHIERLNSARIRQGSTTPAAGSVTAASSNTASAGDAPPAAAPLRRQSSVSSSYASIGLRCVQMVQPRRSTTCTTHSVQRAAPFHPFHNLVFGNRKTYF